MSRYVIVDLEMCKVPKRARGDNYSWANETIQIGAVLLDEQLEIADKFMTYVAPEYGNIDNFIKKLTGISKANLINAPKMKEALQEFIDWFPRDAIAVSWSDNDEIQIRREIAGKGIVIDGLDEILDNWIDCQKTFNEKMKGEKNFSLAEALIAANIIYEDGAHDGLVDAYNTALLFAKMEKEPELILNPYYQRAIGEEEDSCGTSLGNLFKGLDISGFTTV